MFSMDDEKDYLEDEQGGASMSEENADDLDAEEEELSDTAVAAAEEAEDDKDAAFAGDIVGDESNANPDHLAMDFSGEDESGDVELAAGDYLADDAPQEDEGEELLQLEQQVGPADEGSNDTNRVFDPLELAPKVREMHESLSLRAQIEAAIFASPKPIKASDLVELVSYTSGLKEVERIIQDIKEDHATRDGGFTLEYVKGMGYQFQSVPLAAPIMEGMFSSRPRPLSRAALETLSIIAYRQPCTRAVVEFIRGVDSGSIIKNLMDRELIKCVGRKEDAGRPMMFGTTDEFLAVFGIRSLEELPSLQSFQPASETLQQAFDELDELEREVDVEDFVKDETKTQPLMSEGLLAGDAQDDENASEPADTQESVDDQGQQGYEGSLAAAPIQGAVKADEEEYDDENDRHGDEDTKVDSADGEVLTAGSGEVDSGGADLS